MQSRTKITLVLFGILLSPAIWGQHPDRARIDSLKRLLPAVKGLARIDCLNALSEEYWWPPRVYPDSISMWAVQAFGENTTGRYPSGLAYSGMHLGVAEIYRKNYRTSEKYLLGALRIFDSLQDPKGLGWVHLWMGQNLYSQNRFDESLDHFRQSLRYLERRDDREGEGKAWAWMSFLFAARGDYDQSFEYASRSLEIRKHMSDHVCVAASYANLGYLYKSADDYQDALSYYQQGRQYGIEHGIDYRNANWNYFDEPMGTIYQLMNDPDSSFYYLRRAIEIDPNNQMTRIAYGEALLTRQQTDSALGIFLAPLDHFRAEHDQWDLMRVLLDIARACHALHREDDASRFAHEGLAIAAQAGIRPYVIQESLLLSQIYREMKRNDTAVLYLQQYVTLKDSVLKQQFLWRLANYKKQEDFKKQLARVNLLERESNLTEEKLQVAALFRKALLAGLAILLFTGVIVYRNLSLKRKNDRLRNEREQSVLKQRATELEMQALRAQMNPHFIFNCLSSINRFILKNQTEDASDYLTKFSRLIRMVLNHSQRAYISLEDEMIMLKLYMEMERLRFKNCFDYHISFENSLDAASIYIPPLLLQPFVENAIWHGLMHREQQGLISIDLAAGNNVLTCTIEDNGVGREKAAQSELADPAKKSLGMKLTSERLALLNGPMPGEPVIVEDITGAGGIVTGTRVILRMQYRNLSEILIS